MPCYFSSLSQFHVPLQLKFVIKKYFIFTLISIITPSSHSLTSLSVGFNKSLKLSCHFFTQVVYFFKSSHPLLLSPLVCSFSTLLLSQLDQSFSKSLYYDSISFCFSLHRFLFSLYTHLSKVFLSVNIALFTFFAWPFERSISFSALQSSFHNILNSLFHHVFFSVFLLLLVLVLDQQTSLKLNLSFIIMIIHAKSWYILIMDSCEVMSFLSFLIQPFTSLILPSRKSLGMLEVSKRVKHDLTLASTPWSSSIYEHKFSFQLDIELSGFDNQLCTKSAMLIVENNSETKVTINLLNFVRCSYRITQ